MYQIAEEVCREAARLDDGYIYAELTEFHTVVFAKRLHSPLGRIPSRHREVGRKSPRVAARGAFRAPRSRSRTPRSVKLTPVGARLDQRIRSILAEVDLLNDIAREESVGVSGQVTIAVTPEFGSLVASTLFPVARERHPDLTFVMRPAYAFEDMQGPGTDIAFRIGTFKDDRLVARELGAFRRCLVASPGLANAYRIARPEDLADLPCLTAHGDRLGATWTFNSPKEDTAVEVTGSIAVQSFSILFELAVAGQGYAFLPDFMLGDALENGALVRCLPDYVSRPLSVFLTFRPGARRVARIDAAVVLAEELIPNLLSE